MCKHFYDTFNSIKDTIEFNLDWVDEQGYLDSMVFGSSSPILDKPAVCIDVDKRKIITIPTPMGNVVVFQRYTDSDIIVTSLPRSIQLLGGPLDLYGILSPTAIHFLLGDKQNPHIGERVKNLLGTSTLIQPQKSFSQPQLF